MINVKTYFSSRIVTTINDTINDILWHLYYEYNVANTICHHEN